MKKYYGQKIKEEIDTTPINNLQDLLNRRIGGF